MYKKGPHLQTGLSVLMDQKNWNALPEEIKKIVEHKVFKAHLKTYLHKREYN